MDKELIEIIDTAIKVGLGAVISGVTAYFIARYNHSKESEKAYIERRFSILETTIENIDTYTTLLFELFAAIDGIRRMYPNLIKLENEDYYNSIKKVDDEFVKSRGSIQVATSRLRLIGLKKSVNALLSIIDLENELRNKVMFQRLLPSLNELSNWGSRLNKLIEEFHEDIHTAYKA